MSQLHAGQDTRATQAAAPGTLWSVSTSLVASGVRVLRAPGLA